MLRNKHEKERFWYGNLSFWMKQKLKLLTKEGIVINSTEIYYKDPDTNKTVFEIKDTPRWVLMKEPLSFLNIQEQS